MVLGLATSDNMPHHSYLVSSQLPGLLSVTPISGSRPACFLSKSSQYPLLMTVACRDQQVGATVREHPAAPQVGEEEGSGGGQGTTNYQVLCKHKGFRTPSALPCQVHCFYLQMQRILQGSSKLLSPQNVPPVAGILSGKGQQGRKPFLANLPAHRQAA